MAKRGRNFGEEASEADKKKISREGVKKALRIFRFIKPYRLQYAIGFIFLILSTGTTMSFGLLIGQITSVIQGKSDFTLNQVTLFFVGVLVAQADNRNVFVFSTRSQEKQTKNSGKGRL